MIMNVSEFVNGRSEMNADDAVLAEKVVSAFKSVFPNGWIRASRVPLGGRGFYVAFGLVDGPEYMKEDWQNKRWCGILVKIR